MLADGKEPMSTTSKRITLPVLGEASRQRAPRSNKQKKVNIVSLGCPKNQVDSEVILGNLKHTRIVDKAEDADTIVINTCGFIESAKQESIQTILEAIELKKRAAKKGITKEIIVAGCLSERYPKELAAEMPEVDAFFGVHQFDKITERIEGHYQQVLFTERILLNQRHYAYLKISEGCNQRCGFCYIPLIRGNLDSKSITDNVAEAEKLASLGVKELICVSQDTSSYGYDFDRSAPNLRQNKHLIELLHALGEVRGIEWIRVMYLYPSLFSDALIETIATHPKICKYIDMPVQHISDRILKTMRRNTGKKQTTDLLYKIKARMPDVALRTSMIVGYPGETEADFEELCDFVREFQFDRLGVFIYSQEEGTYAYDLEPQVEEPVKKERFNRLMEIQREISHAHNMEKIDKTFRVMIDTQNNEHYIGRTMSDAPEIDNEVIITSSRKLKPGQFVDVKITDATEYDLYAEAL